MWLLSRVSPHVNQEHVLCLEWLLPSHAVCPLAHKLLLTVPAHTQREREGVITNTHRLDLEEIKCFIQSNVLVVVYNFSLFV